MGWIRGVFEARVHLRTCFKRGFMGGFRFLCGLHLPGGRHGKGMLEGGQSSFPPDDCPAQRTPIQGFQNCANDKNHMTTKRAHHMNQIKHHMSKPTHMMSIVISDVLHTILSCLGREQTKRASHELHMNTAQSHVILRIHIYFTFSSHHFHTVCQITQLGLSSRVLIQ
jgi:hypothetical protein